MDDHRDEIATKGRMLQQLSEIEILSSMYPQRGEFELEDPAVISTWKSYLEKGDSCDGVTKGLSFVLKLESFEIVAQIPLNYPHEYPDILVRSPVLDKSGYVKMMSELKSFMVELSDEICMPAIITWLQENINKYIDQFSLAEKSDCNGRYCTNKPTTFSRIWIYSHHIYSSNKRKLILHHAVNLNLTGFCMPGKPGLIVVEGIKYNVDKFWSVIHSLQWQKLTVKEREDFELAESGDKSFAKFENFQERHFNTRQSRGGAHADCGELYKFLEDIECSHVFQSIFGVEGKVPDSNKRK